MIGSKQTNYVLIQVKQTLLFLMQKQRKLQNISTMLTTISDKNCETRTPSPLIQCWLQVCLLIFDLGCLAWLLQASYNIESGGRGDSW